MYCIYTTELTFRVSIVCSEAALESDGHWSRVQITTVKDISRMLYLCLKSALTAIIFLAIETKTYWSMFLSKRDSHTLSFSYSMGCLETRVL